MKKVPIWTMKPEAEAVAATYMKQRMKDDRWFSFTAPDLALDCIIHFDIRGPKTRAAIRRLAANVWEDVRTPAIERVLKTGS